MARTIKLKTAAGWSLYEVKSNQERAIKATEYVADFLSAWDRDSGSKKKDAGTVRKKKGDAPGASGVSADSRLIMKKRVFRDIQQDITDPVEYGLLFAQAVDGVTKDVYPITERTAMQLAALKAQVLFGDCTAASAEARFVQDLESWIAPRLIPNQPKEAWVTGIVKQYQKLRGQSAEQAKALYLESVRGFKHYGAALFPAKHKGLWPHSESVLIAVSSGGIDFVHPRTNETTLSFPYKDVKSYEHEPGLLTITAVPANEDSEFEATEVYPFFTEQSDEIVLLIREYCPTTEYMKKTKVASVVWDLDYASLVRDVEKYRSALLEYGIMRRPGPDGGSKKSMFFTIRKRAGTVRSKTPPLFAADSTGTIGRSTNDSVRPGSVRSRLGDESDDTAVSPVAPLALEDMPAGPGVTDDYGMSDWSFSGKPLMTSLIATPDPEVENWASETSAVLLKFVGPPGATAPDIASGDVQALQAVLERCVDVPPMANELYLQLIKNTSSHPQPDSSQALNMWKLMAIAVGVCAPSGWVLEYTKAHLRQYCVIDNKSKKPRPEEAQHARHCLRVLHRTIATAVRKCAPSADEIAQAIRLTPIRVRIHLMDGNARVIPIDPPDTCEMVLTAVLERLKLKNGRGFAIYEQYKSFQRALHPEQKIADSLYRWEKIAKTENSTEHVRFVFRKRLFLAAQQSTGPAEEALLRAQALAEIGAGLYPVTSEEAIQLVALFAQSYYGDFNYDVPVQYQSLCDLYLPPAFRQPGVAKQVEERHMSFLGMTADQANAEIMQIVRSWPYYGAAIFEVTQNYTKEVPQSCWFAVDSKAVHIMPRQSKQPLITHRLSEIVNFSPSSNSLLLITEDGRK
ncbi:FERM central domain-containing protein [Gaertneriomyces semiglobifer]|nr:FERM central domain-containing protein [Gaertneriomyces semiglobifer]